MLKRHAMEEQKLNVETRPDSSRTLVMMQTNEMKIITIIYEKTHN